MGLRHVSSWNLSVEKNERAKVEKTNRLNTWSSRGSGERRRRWRRCLTTLQTLPVASMESVLQLKLQPRPTQTNYEQINAIYWRHLTRALIRTDCLTNEVGTLTRSFSFLPLPTLPLLSSLHLSTKIDFPVRHLREHTMQKVKVQHF